MFAFPVQPCYLFDYVYINVYNYNIYRRDILFNCVHCNSSTQYKISNDGIYTVSVCQSLIEKIKETHEEHKRIMGLVLHQLSKVLNNDIRMVIFNIFWRAIEQIDCLDG